MKLDMINTYRHFISSVTTLSFNHLPS